MLRRGRPGQSTGVDCCGVVTAGDGKISGFQSSRYSRSAMYNGGLGDTDTGGAGPEGVIAHQIEARGGGGEWTKDPEITCEQGITIGEPSDNQLQRDEREYVQSGNTNLRSDGGSHRATVDDACVT